MICIIVSHNVPQLGGWIVIANLILYTIFPDSVCILEYSGFGFFIRIFRGARAPSPCAEYHLLCLFLREKTFKLLITSSRHFMS